MRLKNRFLEIENNKQKSQLIQKGYGFLEHNKLKLDLFETYYLFEKKRIKLEEHTNQTLFSYCEKKIKNFEDKYLVFKDFKELGYVVKDGSFFGFDFRVYENTKKHTHTKYVVDVKRTNKDEINKIIKSERLANSIKADYVLAIIDNENKIRKIKLNRIIK